MTFENVRCLCFQYWSTEQSSDWLPVNDCSYQYQFNQTTDLIRSLVCFATLKSVVFFELKDIR
jgi:hypothetical protein